MRRLLIESEKRFQRRGCVEITDRPGNRLLLPGVEMPDNFTVGRVEEWHAVAIPVAWSLERALRVTFGLLQDVLRIYRNLPGFDDAEQFPAHEQTVIGGARRRWQLFDGVAVERSEVEAVPVADDFPGRIHRTQPGVDTLFAGLPLRFSHNVCNKPPFSQFARSSKAKSIFLLSRVGNTKVGRSAGRCGKPGDLAFADRVRRRASIDELRRARRVFDKVERFKGCAVVVRSATAGGLVVVS